MNAIQSLGALLLRVWGAWAAFYSLGGLASLFERKISNATDQVYFIWTLVGADIGIVLGLAAWVLAPRLARRFIPDAPPNEKPAVLDTLDIVQSGTYLIGAYYLMNYLPKLGSRLVKIAIEVSNSASYGPVKLDSQEVYYLTLDAISVSLALILALRPQQITNLFSLLREAGVNKGNNL